MTSSQQSFFDRYARGEAYSSSSAAQSSPFERISQRETTTTQPSYTQNYTSSQNTYNTSGTNAQNASYSRQTVENTYSANSGISRYGQTSYSSNQSSSIGQAISRPSAQSYEIEGRREQKQGDVEGYLKWASTLNNDRVISGSSDYAQLTNLKDAILELRSHYFNPKSGLSVQGPERDQLSRRFLLVEHEIEGLMKRRIDYTTKDHLSGDRTIDYSVLLNEKENQIIQLQKKIQNLEERLRRSNAREIELENKIVAFKAQYLSQKGLSGSRLQDYIRKESDYEKAQQDLNNLREAFQTTCGVWLNQLNNYRLKYPSDNWELDSSITERLQKNNIKPITVNDYAFLEVHSDKTVEVPVQDTRTKRLVHLLTTNLKKMSQKYPKIKEELNAEIIQLFNQEIIDLIEVDQFDRLIEIVRFVPQSVRVQNVYAYSSSKSRRVEFHLRVLLKALLEQLEKIKAKTGAVLQIDEGVIGMINQQILGVVNVDDILKVFRVVPKIVQVQKVVEKVVDRLVEVPKVIPVQKYVEKIVEIPKYVQVEKVVHKPVEVVKVVDSIVEKFVEVPTIEEKIVEVPTEKQVLVPITKEVPKVIEIQKIVKEVVVDTKYVQIQKPVNHVVATKQIVEIIKQVAVPVEVVREVVKEVEVIVEKIVPVEVVRVEVVEVEKIVEKVIKEVVYEPVNNTEVAIKEKLVEVPVYIDKIIPVQTIVTQILNVPQRIEVPVVVKEKETQVKTVEVVVEKVVQKVVIKQIDRVVNKIAEKVVQVIKPVDRVVQVPMLQDKIVTVPIQKPVVVIEKVHVPHVVPIKCIEEKIIEKPKIIEIEKPYIQYIKDVQVVNCAIEKIVEVPQIIERIKEVKVRVEKIVNKLVEVPKVVEVQKIVEKVVVVPRVVETLVEVPQIVEVTVQKIVEVPKVIEVEKVVEKIVYREKPVEVEKIKNVFIDVDRPVQVIRDVPVVAEKVIQKKEVIEVPVQKIVTVNQQVPVEILVDKIIPYSIDNLKVVEVQKPTTLVVEVPKIVDRKVEVPVEVVNTVTNEVHLVEKIEVPVAVEVTRTNVKEVEKVIRQPVAVAEPKVYSESKVVINEKFTPVREEVRVPVQVPVPQPAQKPQIVERFIEKVVETKVQEPRFVTVEILREVPVQTVKIVELQKVINHIETQHKVVQIPVDRIVPAPTYQQYPVQKDIINEKVVEVKTVQTRLKPERQVVERIVQKENFTTVTDTVPCYETQLKVVDRYESTQVPSFTTQERIVTVPEFQQKIFERIVVMPQVVEVLKYVTEICESDSLAVGLSVDIVEQEKRYKELYGVTRKQLQIVLTELRKLRSSQPHLSGIIDLLEKYVVDFDRLAAVQRIVPVDREKIVEKQVAKPVLVPTKDSQSIRSQLAHALLIQKLVLQLKRIKKENNNINLKLDNDVGLFFFSEFYNQAGLNSAGNFQDSLSKYTSQSMSKLNALGGDWTNDHEIMLSTILQERFTMSSMINQANIQIEKAKAISSRNATALKQLQNKWLPLQKQIKDKQTILNNILNNNPTLRGYPDLVALAKDFDAIVSGSNLIFEPIQVLDTKFQIGTGSNWNRAISRINELELAYAAIATKLLETEKAAPSKAPIDTASQAAIALLRSQNERLVKEMDNLKRSTSISSSSATQKTSEYESQIRQSTVKIQDLENELRQARSRIQELELQLKTANSRYADLESQLRTSQLRVQELQSELKMTKQIKSSAATETKLVDSKYSSSSSNFNIAKSATYDAPNYQTSSVYSSEGASGLAGSGIKPSSSYLQTTGNTYTTGGTAAYQGSASGYKQLSSSGLQGQGITQNTNVTGTTVTSTNRTVTGATQTTSYSYGSSRASKASEYSSAITGADNTYGNSSNSYKASGSIGTTGTVAGYGATSYGSTNTSGPSYGSSGLSGQYGASVSNTTTGLAGTTGFTASFTSDSLSGSGMRSSGTGYTFQTKKI